MKKNKKSKFDLSDDDSDEEIKMTHKGKAVDDMDDFKEQINFDSDDDKDVPADIVDKLHF